MIESRSSENQVELQAVSARKRRFNEWEEEKDDATEDEDADEDDRCMLYVLPVCNCVLPFPFLSLFLKKAPLTE